MIYDLINKKIYIKIDSIFGLMKSFTDKAAKVLSSQSI